MLDISRAIFAAPVTRLVLTTPTPIEGGDKALLAALAAPVTARDDRVAAAKVDFSQLPALGQPGTIASETPLPGLRVQRLEFANGVTALVADNKVEPGKVRVNVRFGSGNRSVAGNAPNLLWTGDYALMASGVGPWGQNELDQATNGRQFQMGFRRRVGALLDQGVAHHAVGAVVLVVDVLGKGLLVADGVVHHAVEGRIVAREADVGDPEGGELGPAFGLALGLGHLSAESLPALVGDGVQQFGLVLEVMIGRGRADAGLPRHGPQRQRAGSLGLQKAPGGVNERAPQVAVVVGARFGAFSFAHRITIISYLSTVQMPLTLPLAAPI